MDALELLLACGFPFFQARARRCAFSARERSVITFDSIFAELGFKTAAEIYASDTPGRMASSLGSVLSPSVAATVHAMMEGHATRDDAEIAAMAADLVASPDAAPRGERERSRCPAVARLGVLPPARHRDTGDPVQSVQSRAR